MLSLLLIPALAFQTPAPDVIRMDCSNAHEQMAKLDRGPPTIVSDNSVDEDGERVTRTALTSKSPIHAYSSSPAITHIERYSYDTKLYSDTIEIILPARMLTARAMFRVIHKRDCLPSSMLPDQCLMPDFPTKHSPIIMYAQQRASDTVISCVKVRDPER
jgi:hypothetical protein